MLLHMAESHDVPIFSTLSSSVKTVKKHSTVEDICYMRGLNKNDNYRNDIFFFFTVFSSTFQKTTEPSLKFQMSKVRL